MARGVEERVARLARRQQGVVTRGQLLDLGLHPGTLQRRIAAGRYRRMHRGVYLMGPTMPARAREMAAVLACGPVAVLSHRSAARLWSIVAGQDEAEPVDISVIGGHNRSRPGLRVTRLRTLHPDERTTLHRLPIVTPGRALVDIAASVGTGELERAAARVVRERLVTTERLEALVQRHAGRPGIPALRAVLEREGGPRLTRSEAEARFLALIRKAQIPVPETNVPFHGFEIDFLWRAERVAVEIDGYHHHGVRPRFEGDRRRATRLASLGIQVVPLTWRQIVEDDVPTAVQIAETLLRARLG